jgi:hypothetical protein
MTESVSILTDKSIHREGKKQGNRFIEPFEFCQSQSTNQENTHSRGA